MADGFLLQLLSQSVKAWNEWRKKHPDALIDLAEAILKGFDLSNAELSGVNLSGADLSNSELYNVDLSYANLEGAFLVGANLTNANLSNANLSSANLFKANLSCTNLSGATLSNSNLRKVNFSSCNLFKADLSDAKLSDAILFKANLLKTSLFKADLFKANLSYAYLEGVDLQYASLVETTLEKTILKDCFIYGHSAWGLIGRPKDQTNLIVTKRGDSIITVDNLQVAQFVHLLLTNATVRDVIDTITSKAVLVLGRFTEDRKAVLEALHIALRKRNYLPILFDFTGPTSRDITETVSTLAHLARFVIADITDAKSIPQELMAIIPSLPSVPIQPLLLSSQREYGMFEHFKRYPWVMETYQYENRTELIKNIEDKVLKPAEIWIKNHKK